MNEKSPALESVAEVSTAARALDSTMRRVCPPTVIGSPCSSTPRPPAVRQ